MKKAVLILLFLLTASANASVFDDASKETGIPASLLEAVAKVESSLHAYAFAVWSRKKDKVLDSYCRKRRKIRGKYLYNECYCSSREKAEAFLTYLLSKKSVFNFSVGLMQVNSSWLKSLDVNPYQLLDPKFNVFVGALILKFYYKLEGDWIKALSRYYGSRKVSVKYVSKIAKELKEWEN
jgi:hypothetical protein